MKLKNYPRKDQDGLRPFPICPDLLERLLAEYDFPPQERRVVELVLCGASDESIREIMGIARSTIRTYTTRIHRRMAVANRLELVLQLFSDSHRLVSCPHCRPQG